MSEKRDKFVFCTNCGDKNNVGARFCQSCGTPLGNVEKRQELAGKIIKCPNCGEGLNAFITVCPSCGYELRSANSNNILKELAAKLEAVDLRPEVVSHEKPKKNSELNILTDKEKQKIDLIRTFPIPNTKEDLYEFLIMAISNIDTDHIEGWNSSGQSKGEKAVSEAWKAKYEQAYHKADICFGDSREFQELNKFYLDKMQKYEHKKDMAHRILVVFAVVVMLLVFVSMGYMIKENAARYKAIDDENERLEIILSEIQNCIEEGEYTKALSLNATLYFNVSENITPAVKAREHWDDVRKELYDVIESVKENNQNSLTR